MNNAPHSFIKGSNEKRTAKISVSRKDGLLNPALKI